MLISLIVFLLIVALLYWLLTYLPLPPMVKTAGTVILVVLCVIYLIGILTGHQYLRL